MTEVITRRFIVTGRVQGVFFRASTRDRATQLGLLGYAKNLGDGSVEVVVSGTASNVEVLAQWLWEGPPTAKVLSVQHADVAATDVKAWSGFVTL